MTKPFLEYHPLLRIAGVEPTALEILSEALPGGELPISGDMPDGDIHAADPYQIDAALEVTLETGFPLTDPPSGATYAGLTPAQRGTFLMWAQDAVQPAPPAFQRLLMAHVEVNLLDSTRSPYGLHRELARLSSAPAWQMNEWLGRAMLLTLWLHSNAAGIAEWTSQVDLPIDMLELAIGLQALLHENLRAEQIRRLAVGWRLSGSNSPPDVLSLRLNSLTDLLGQPPLEAVLESLNEEELSPQPWRTAHRALRFSVPQPSIRQHLQPMLDEILGMVEASHNATEAIIQEPATANQDREWQLILEFGHSRSEFYAIVVDFAQRMPGYVQLLDENKRLVHRVTIRKREMRRFWHIWDYVQNWSATHVYVNGQELEQWKIWPYSQYLR